MFSIKNKFFIVLLCFIAAKVSVAGEEILSPEYVKARSDVIKEQWAIYRSCKRKIGSKYFSDHFDKCIEDPSKSIRKERCAHNAQLATEQFIIKEKWHFPCQNYRPTEEDFIKRLEEVVSKKNINKYQ